jgi:hypothetical protein
MAIIGSESPPIDDGANNKEPEALLSRLFKKLKSVISDDFIIDSKRGAKLGRDWIIDLKIQSDDNDELRFMGMAEAKKLARWINTKYAHMPQTPEQHFVFWSSIESDHRILANLGTFIAGAELRRKAGSFISKTAVVDQLYLEMQKVDATMTRSKAIKLANGISKFYGLVSTCGLDVMFCKRFTLRSMRGMTKSYLNKFMDEIGDQGGGITNEFIRSLEDCSRFKKLFENSITSMIKFKDLDNIEPKRKAKTNAPKAKTTKKSKTKIVVADLEPTLPALAESTSIEQAAVPIDKSSEDANLDKGQ